MTGRGTTARRRTAFVLPALGIAVLLAVGVPAAAGAAAPVLCTVILSVASTDTFSCHRQDTGASFETVPRQRYLHVTDVLVVRNTLATTGDYYATIGRESGGILPSNPSITASGTPLDPTELHFETPVFVLAGGESLAARNDSSSDFPINIYASGFLAPAVLVPEPAENLLLASGIGGLALLRRIRAHRR